MVLTGEEIQLQGADGSHRAKRWLEATCRAEVKWNNPGSNVTKLQLQKVGAAQGSSSQADFFSFDLGGNFLGGDVDGHTFAAEVKKYNHAGDQGTEYRRFLAKSYCSEVTNPKMFDHYLWITWAPFLVMKWSDLTSEEFVSTAIEHDDENKKIALGRASVDATVVANVASKLIIVVLSDRQEQLLSLHGNELMGVRKALLEMRASA